MHVEERDRADRRLGVQPFYFGPRSAPLFGVHHAPPDDRQRRPGVVLCPALGHDYLVAHRAYREMAVRLAGAGHHVLRFDYHATGDSAGECEAGTPSRWMDDVSTAMGELRLRMGRSSVTLVGCRLGATLVLLTAAARGDVERAVLWDPVISGRDHVAELHRRQRQMLHRTHVTPAAAPLGTCEFLGFAMAESACRQIADLDLLALTTLPVQEAFIVTTTPGDGVDPLVRHLSSLGCAVDRQHTPVAAAWDWIEDAATIFVPLDVVTRIVARVAAVP